MVQTSNMHKRKTLNYYKVARYSVRTSKSNYHTKKDMIKVDMQAKKSFLVNSYRLVRLKERKRVIRMSKKVMKALGKRKRRGSFSGVKRYKGYWYCKLGTIHKT